MGMTIDDLKAYCMEEEATHRLRCKQYDNASGYTRSKNKDIRTARAIREELLGDYYQQMASIMRKYQQLQSDYENRLKADMVAMLTELQLEIEELNMHGSIQLQSYRQKTGRYRQGFERARNLSTKIIQQKINALEENTDGATSN